MGIRNIKISTRLGIGFAVIISLILFLGMETIGDLKQSASLTDKLYKHPYAVSTAVLRIQGNIVRMHRSMKDVALAKNAGQMDQAKSRVDGYEAKVYQDFEVVKERFLGSKAKVSNAIQIFTDWRPIRNEVIGFMKKGKRAEAAQITKAKGAKHVARLNETISDFEHFADNKADEFHVKASKQKDATLAFVYGLLAGIVVVSVVLAWLMSTSVTRPVANLLAGMNKITAGDLTSRIDDAASDEIGRLGQSTNDFISRIHQVVSGAQESANGLNSAAQQINRASQNLSDTSSQQAASVEETSSSLEQMSSSVSQNADNARQTEKIASVAAQQAGEGGEQVSSTVDAMKHIADKISVIEDISYQTNLLALNAAIEAARAGEHGRGFAVVATEVRKLAARSETSAGEISELAKNSVDIAEKAGSLLEEIVPSIKKTADLVEEITAASEEQASGIGEVNTAIGQMDQVTQNNAAMSEQLSATADSLRIQTQELVEMMAFFRVDAQGSSSNTTRPAASTTVIPIAAQARHNKAARLAPGNTASRPMVVNGVPDDFERY